VEQGGVGRDPRSSDGSSHEAEFRRAIHVAVGSEEAFEQLVAFATLLAREGEMRGLIGPREIPRLWSRHIVNSLAINDFVPEGATVADIGSGAGFPGVVLAITRPDVTVALIDSMERRTEWLEHVRVALGLTNVVVVTNRAEALHGLRHFDVVTARAVAPMDRLARWTLPLVRSGGRLVALKGQRAVEELTAAHKSIRKEGGSHAKVHEVPSPLDDSVTRVIVVMKGGDGSA
jgi:16S rRNA (guanine527-N7)-methyltransferase